MIFVQYDENEVAWHSGKIKSVDYEKNTILVQEAMGVAVFKRKDGRVYNTIIQEHEIKSMGTVKFYKNSGGKIIDEIIPQALFFLNFLIICLDAVYITNVKQSTEAKIMTIPNKQEIIEKIFSMITPEMEKEYFVLCELRHPDRPGFHIHGIKRNDNGYGDCALNSVPLYPLAITFREAVIRVYQGDLLATLS